MSRVKRDTAFLEKYRDDYHNGTITQEFIKNNESICRRIMDNHIKKYNWNTQQALQNQKKVREKCLLFQMKKYQEKYECGNITLKEIAKILNVKHQRVFDVAKKYNFDKSVNKKKRLEVAVKNLKPLSKQDREKAYTKKAINRANFTKKYNFICKFDNSTIEKMRELVWQYNNSFQCISQKYIYETLGITRSQFDTLLKHYNLRLNVNIGQNSIISRRKFMQSNYER